MESQKTLNSQSNFEKEEKSWKYHIRWFSTMPQSFKKNMDMWNLKVTEWAQNGDDGEKRKQNYIIEINWSKQQRK